MTTDYIRMDTNGWNNPTEHECRLLFCGDESLVFQLPTRKPNAWWRFWQRVFFGFVWKDVESDPTTTP